MAAGGAQVLRALDYNWLECQDAQGIFYFNEATQQSSETVPPELLGGKASAPGPVTYASPMSTAAYNSTTAAVQQLYGKAQVIGGGITQQQLPQSYISQMQAQQQMYAPSQTRPAYPQQVQAMQYQQPSYQPQSVASSYAPIQQTVQVQPAQYQVQQPSQYQVQQPRYQVQQPQYQVQQSMPQGSPSVQKMAFGDWAVYQDELGEFYAHVPTGQQFEQPPPELIQAYQQYKAYQQ